MHTTTYSAYKYDYESLDKLLTEFVTPGELSVHLDDLAFVLMSHVCLVENVRKDEMLELYAVISDLRDVIKDLKKQN